MPKEDVASSGLTPYEFRLETWYRSSFTRENITLSLDGPISLIALLVIIVVLYGLSQIFRDQRRRLSKEINCFAFDVEVDESGVRIFYKDYASYFYWDGLDSWRITDAGLELFFHLERFSFSKLKIGTENYNQTLDFLKRRGLAKISGEGKGDTVTSADPPLMGSK